MKKIRIISATPKIQVANPAYNATQIIALMQKAHAEKAQLLVLPELCITGATCGDLFFQPTLLNAAKVALGEIVEASYGMDMVVVVGLPIISEDMDAPQNVAAVIVNGCVVGMVHKSSDVCGKVFKCKEIPGFTFSVAIGEDATCKVDGQFMIINPTAYAELVGAAGNRREMAQFNSQALHQSIFVIATAGGGESTTDAVYPGHNIIAYKGEILAESLPFGDGWAAADIQLQEPQQFNKHEGILEFSLNESTLPSLPCYLQGIENATLCEKRDVHPHPFIRLCPNPEEVLSIQATGLAARLSHTNGTAVIGISGGLDSCLALLVTVQAYQILQRPVSEIVAITMPCFGTTAHTKNNAHSLCTALGISCREIDITESVTLHLQDIGHPPDTFDIVFENAQARMRTMVLMNVANQANGSGIVIGTGSLSELALGWATYNGDHMSMYAVNAGVPKTLVRHLVQHIAASCENTELKKVLESILATKVSPELLPTPQYTEDLVGPYELHDFFIYHMLCERQTPTQIFHLASSAFASKFENSVILHWMKTFYRRFFSQQFKRSCLPDGPQVMCISLSPRIGFQMPSDASPAPWLAELDAL